MIRSRDSLIRTGLLLITSSAFWVAIIVDYFSTRGLQLSEAFYLLSIYQFLIVILEFPTGVIGDKFGHKLSVIIGTISILAAFFLLTIATSIAPMFITIFLMATGISLISGSDTALLASQTENFKASNAKIGSYGLIYQIITISLGSYLYTLDSRLPFYASMIMILIGLLLIVFFTKNCTSDKYKNSNIFRVGLDSIKIISKEKSILTIIVSLGVLIGIIGSLKWYLSPILEISEINQNLWGVLFSIIMLASAIGTRISNRISNRYISISFIILSLTLLTSGITGSATLIIIFLSIGYFFHGILVNLLKTITNKVAPENLKASIFSVSSLISRLINGLIIGLTGTFVASSTPYAALYIVSIMSLLSFFAYILHVKSHE